jgi:predicted nucleic-acid-binding protein
MIEFIDTNLVLRYLTGVPEDQHRLAQALIDGDTTLFITDVVLLETAHALRTQYGASREEIVDALVGFVRKENIHVHTLDRDTVIEALLLCRPSNRVSFGDAMIWTAVRCAQPARLYSFDERFPSDRIEGRRP